MVSGAGVDDPRCATDSDAVGEPLAGTASTWSACLMVEENGPWGPKVLTGSRLSPELREVLDSLEVRVLLVRRHGRSQARASTRVMASWSAGDGSWLETVDLASAEDLLDLDLTPLQEGRSLGWQRVEDPVFLVCTHGRRDVCCAERGRPVAAALSAAYPEQTWECSHVGGHRFAANLVVLPEGLAYGRVAPDAAVALADAWTRGRVEPGVMRGWVAQSPVEQATEVAVRRRLRLDGRADVRVTPAATRSGATDLVVQIGAGEHTGRHEITTTPVEARDGAGEPLRVLASCGDEETVVATAWEVGPLR